VFIRYGQNILFVSLLLYESFQAKVRVPLMFKRHYFQFTNIKNTSLFTSQMKAHSIKF